MKATNAAAKAAHTSTNSAANERATTDYLTNAPLGNQTSSPSGDALDDSGSYSSSSSVDTVPAAPSSTEGNLSISSSLLPPYEALLHCWEPLRLALSRLLGSANSNKIAEKLPFLFERAVVCLLHLWPVIADVPWPRKQPSGEATVVEEDDDPSGILTLVEQLMASTLPSEHRQELAERFAAAGLKRLQTLKTGSLNPLRNHGLTVPAVDAAAAPKNAHASSAGAISQDIKRQWALVLSMLSAAADHAKGLSEALSAIEVLLEGSTHKEAVAAVNAVSNVGGGNSSGTLDGGSPQTVGSNRSSQNSATSSCGNITQRATFLPSQGTGSKLCRANAQGTEVLLLSFAHCTEAWVGQYGSCSGRVVGALQSAASSSGKAHEEKLQSSSASYFYGSGGQHQAANVQGGDDEEELPPIHPPLLLPTKANLEQHARCLKLLALLVGRSSYAAEQSSNAKNNCRRQLTNDGDKTTMMKEEPFTSVVAAQTNRISSSNSSSSSYSRDLLPPQSIESEAEVAGGGRSNVHKTNAPSNSGGSGHATSVDERNDGRIDFDEGSSISSGSGIHVGEAWCNRTSALERWRRALVVLQEATELPYNDTVGLLFDNSF